MLKNYSLTENAHIFFLLFISKLTYTYLLDTYESLTVILETLFLQLDVRGEIEKKNCSRIIQN